MVSVRSTFLVGVASRWAQHDPARHPFAHLAAARLPGHDDREQFLAGIDLILAGITGSRRPSAEPPPTDPPHERTHP